MWLSDFRVPTPNSTFPFPSLLSIVVSLFRPKSGRVVAGVALGIAEMYRIPVVIVRLFWIAAFLATPVALLLYVLLTISMPSEEVIVSELRSVDALGLPDRTARFEVTTRILSARVLDDDSQGSSIRRMLGVIFVLAGVALEIPRLQGLTFSYQHPIATGFMETISRFGTATFYVTAGILAIFAKRRSSTPVALPQRLAQQLELDRSPARLVGGLAAGISAVMGIDAAYIRIVLVLLNIFSFGIFGIAYLAIVMTMRRARRKQDMKSSADIDQPESISSENAIKGQSRFRLTIGMLLLLLGAIRFASDIRLFFFNESFFQGLILGALGFVLAIRGIKASSRYSTVLVLAGVCVLLLGVSDFCSAVFHLQFTAVDRFEVTCLIGLLTLAYYSTLFLQGTPRKIGLALAASCLVTASLMALAVIPPHYLVALIQFYEFFYPVIVVGFGIWLAVD